MRALFDSPHRFTILGLVVLALAVAIGATAYVLSLGSLRPGPEVVPDPVREVQDRVDEAGFEWQADRTPFTDMTPEERQRWLGGLPPDAGGDDPPAPDVHNPPAPDTQNPPVPEDAVRKKKTPG